MPSPQLAVALLCAEWEKLSPLRFLCPALGLGAVASKQKAENGARPGSIPGSIPWPEPRPLPWHGGGQGAHWSDWWRAQFGSPARIREWLAQEVATGRLLPWFAVRLWLFGVALGFAVATLKTSLIDHPVLRVRAQSHAPRSVAAAAAQPAPRPQWGSQSPTAPAPVRRRGECPDGRKPTLGRLCGSVINDHLLSQANLLII